MWESIHPSSAVEMWRAINPNGRESRPSHGRGGPSGREQKRRGDAAGQPICHRPKPSARASSSNLVSTRNLDRVPQ